MADQAETSRNLILAPKVRDLFWDEYGNWIPSDYKVMHGGRNGLKSWGFARVAIMVSLARKVRIACGREYQTSIEESVHQTLVSQIQELGYGRYFQIGKRAITSCTGSRFFFAGIKTEPGKFKSTEGIDILWVEEGEKVSEDSWQKITPTIRAHGSEIWCGFNPDLPSDPTSIRFIVKPIPGARIVQTNWRDNPWLSEKARRDMEYLRSVDPDGFHHVWEGGFRLNSAAQIFKGKYIIEAFEPGKDWNGPYQGADWGFSQDPSTLLRMWIHGTRLYIEHEAYGVGVDIDKTPELFDQVLNARATVTRADSARPETISYMQRHGYPRVVAAKKWDGSVEDGIAFLRQFEQIVIHPRCGHTAEEAKLYSFKVDKLDPSIVLTDIVDKHNHCWDAARYGLQPLISNAKTGFLAFMKGEVDAMNERKRLEAQESAS